MSTPPQAYLDYPPEEEKLNILSHGLGVVLSLVACVFLVVKGVDTSVLALQSFVVYGCSLVLLYLASTLYHKAKNPIIRERLNFFDNAAIFILIAGTYTPFCLLTLKGSEGTNLLIAVWIVAAAGIVFKIFFINRFRILNVLLYVAMGLMVLYSYKSIISNLSEPALQLLVLGCLAYLLGAVLYSISKIPFNHAIFHVLVLLGSALHFWCIYGYLA